MNVMKQTKTMVELTPAEVAFATDTGILRNIANREAGHMSAIIGMYSCLQADIQGARAELAAAKYFNLPWTGRVLDVEKWKKWKARGGHDVGPLEIRSTHYKKGHMPMFKGDDPDVPYVLSIAHSEHRFEFVGWCYGYVGKKPEFWDDPGNHGRPYYCVPRSVLRPVYELEMCLSSMPYYGVLESDIE